MNTGEPLLCVAGGCAKIKIFEALTGVLRTVCEPQRKCSRGTANILQTFTGHGGVRRSIF